MGRGTTIFIVTCMGIIALSVAAVLVYRFGRPAGEALSLSLAMMCTMIMVHVLLSRSRDRGAVSEAVDRLEDRLAEIDGDVANLEGRLSGVEHTIPRRTREEIDPLFAEVEVLGTLVKQMAEAMSDMEGRFEEQRALAAPPPPPELAYRGGGEPAYAAAARPHDPAPAYRGQPVYAPIHDVGHRESARHAETPPAAYLHDPATAQPPLTAGRRDRPELGDPILEDLPPFEAPKADPAMRELIRGALNANRVDLYLQPIVTLPQRRVKYYEALTRLRDANGQTLEPRVFMAEAIRSGLVPRIDNLLLFRSVQVIRKLANRNRDAALFCNVSSLSLVDETFFPGFLEFVRANRNFGDLLIFEFTQADVAQMGVMEMESLGALAEIGFRFSIDQIVDLKMDFKALADRGFRFAKLNADYLIGRKGTDHGHIHPADFGDLLNRYGMELVADHVETESQVLELLDFDVKLAQGFLFSPPRPVRAEILQGAPAPAPRKRAAG
ncbi:EAL domain-containing protein [Polymorphum gilvum]|uniref:Cyclic diguanylate phosphodiesterase domain protein n=1 Tax=Polymorphum gilvum (strain LMG 25793 / CGMCC 1.9160 / SL003B-26A1) TaxID=991905 RepID=F2J037_POLGS|nr:EAL domain-containing protein [Polymorphum gilvum]ADZ71872.1 Cyclic diguanylate phosphodiesterase domain protein [Polymorphum gilvum SL003B-26A1]